MAVNETNAETVDAQQVQAALADIWNSMGNLTGTESSVEQREASLFDDFLESSPALAEAARDSQLPFNRLVSLSERIEHVKESIDNALASKASGIAGAATLVAGVGAALWMGSKGMIHPVDHSADYSFMEMLKEHPIGFGLPVAGGAAMAAYTLASSLDRGYARLQGLTEAHDRLLDGAGPNDPDLLGRMSEQERQQYAGILRHVYTALQDRSSHELDQFKNRLSDGLSQLISDYQGRPDASAISRVLDRIEERLSNALNPDHPEVDAPSTTDLGKSPGMG